MKSPLSWKPWFRDNGLFLYATGSFLKNSLVANSRLLVSKGMLCYDETIKEAI
jgi:hypothetical protein